MEQRIQSLKAQIIREEARLDELSILIGDPIHARNMAINLAKWRETENRISDAVREISRLRDEAI